MLWIDQICINQGDNHEKSEQVKMMPRIYSMAKQVLVWLGPAGQGSDDAMDFYAKVGEAIRERGLQHYCSSEMMPLLGAAVQTEDPGDQLWQKLNTVQTLARQLLLPRLQAMVDWDRRPWFGRVWVVQEFCFGADPVFVCGDKRLAADHVKTTRLLLGLGITADFVEAVRNFGPDKLLLLETLADDPTTAFFGARTWRQRYEGGRPYPDNVMLELLRKVYVGRTASATLRQDRVFSLVGMAPDAHRLGVTIDYDKTPVQVLTSLSKTLIENGSLDVLAYVQFPRDVAGLPTWVPDWRPNLRPSFYPHPAVSLSHDHGFKPSGDRPPFVVTARDDTVLGLGGFVVDTVEEVGGIWTHDNLCAALIPHYSCVTEVRSFCRRSVLKNEPIYASSQRRDEAEWRVPIADNWVAFELGGSAVRRATNRAMRALAEFHILMVWVESGRGGGPQAAPDDGEPLMYRLSMGKMSGMPPFMTQLGYVGMGPPGMRSGDVVAILFGARVCSVLRPAATVTGAPRQYYYVGEAYCDGVMDGELLGQRSEETFYLV